MSVTSRYLLRTTTTPLVTAMVIGLLIMLAERMVRLLDVTLGKQNSFSVVFEMLGYLVPHYLGVALPAAFFLGLLFGFNRLSQESEIDAFLAAGIGLHQLARPLLFLAVAFMAVAVVIFGYIQPHTRYAYRAILFAVKNVEVFYLAEEGVFMRAGSRTFILEKLSRQNRNFKRIFMFQDKGKAGTETVTARNGSLIAVPGRARPVLRLRGGHRLKIQTARTASQNGSPPRHTVSKFDLIDTPLGSDKPVVFRRRGGDERELTLPELFKRQNDPPKHSTKAEMRAELHHRLIGILTIPILPILALPFALGRRRGHRPYRFGVALVILIVFHEIFQQGALAVRYQGVSPYLSMWAPFAIFAGFSAWRFYKTCFSIMPDGLEPIFDRLTEVLRWIRVRVFRAREIQ